VDHKYVPDPSAVSQHKSMKTAFGSKLNGENIVYILGLLHKRSGVYW
jgi:hypothetical protein